MVISTSSHNLRLTEDICKHVETSLRDELGHVSDQVVSVDARLEAVDGLRDDCDMKAVLRVDLRNHRNIVSEIQANNLYTAIRRGARDSARAVDRQLRHSSRITGQRHPEKFHAFGRFPAPNV